MNSLDLLVFIGIMLCLSSIVFLVIVEDEKKKRKQRERLLKSGIFEVDRMTGEEFEVFLNYLLQTMGYRVRKTKTSGDYGADLVLETNSKTIVVQAKRYKNKVGLTAVQEIVSAKSYYDADECWVVTNNYFTAPAVKLGNSNGVLLIDRDLLVEWILEENKGA